MVASVSQAPKIPDSTLPIMQMDSIFHGEAKSFPSGGPPWDLISKSS